jgi:hypothetical protein
MLGDGGVATGDTGVAIADATVGLALTGALADLSDAELNALANDISQLEGLPSTEVQMMSNPVGVPSILPDSVVQDLEAY